ncbi:hypothetical protein HDK77DRAFT_155839 [Phyllosticta capitalensis]
MGGSKKAWGLGGCAEIVGASPIGGGPASRSRAGEQAGRQAGRKLGSSGWGRASLGTRRGGNPSKGSVGCRPTTDPYANGSLVPVAVPAPLPCRSCVPVSPLLTCCGLVSSALLASLTTLDCCRVLFVVSSMDALAMTASLGRRDTGLGRISNRNSCLVSTRRRGKLADGCHWNRNALGLAQSSLSNHLECQKEKPPHLDH